MSVKIMAFVIKFVKGVRNHWKKSTFAVIALSYGVNYVKESYDTHQLMRAYCEEARKYGLQPLPVTVSPRNVTVILNPNANKRKATKQFEEYCAPILHLAGICVDIVQTESEGHARTLIEELKQTDAIVVAGGDGTLSEVVTGLMRRSNNDLIVNPCPVGVLPLGRTNTFANILFPGGESLKTVRSLADAAMAIVEDNIKTVDVMKIEIMHQEGVKETLNSKTSEQEKSKVDQIQEKAKLDQPQKDPLVEQLGENQEVVEHEEKETKEEKKETKEDKKEEKKEDKEKEVAKPTKPVYAVASLEWGAFRDAYAKRDKYWYFGSLRNYVTYIFNGYKNSLCWNCSADISYSEPCEGCKNCHIKEETKNKRWWHGFIGRRNTATPQKDFSKIVNENCSTLYNKQINTSDLLLTTNITNEGPAQLSLNLGPDTVPYLDFVSQGWQTVKGERRNVSETIHLKQVEILPKDIDKEIWFSIDKEDYEVKPIRVTLLPKVLKVFCKKNCV